MPPPYLLHPIAVHFPIAILAAGFAAAVGSLWRRRAPAWLSEAVSWLLWLGTASAWAALCLGLLAEDSVPHVPMAWDTMADHKELAFWTAGIFTALSAWRYLMKRRYERIFVLAWLVGVVVLAATGYHGGELVFTFGVGVQK